MARPTRPRAPRPQARPVLPPLLVVGALASAALAAAPLVTRPLPAQPAAQPAAGRVTGTVVDSISGRPLAGAQVQLVGLRLGSATGDDGRFAITGIPAGTYTVEVRRIGYTPSVRRGVVVAAGGATPALGFRLSTAALNLQAVVTTGVVDPTSGTRVPFTVGRVSAEQVPVPPTNAVEALAGRVAGAQIVSSGQPGSGINVQLRTPSSISKSNAPLIVVDGVILAQTVDAGTADLNSLDIESVEVVKGAAAASLYGSRASNGVIQIRTRRGAGLSEGRTSVTARSEYGQNGIQNLIPFSRHHAFLMQNGQYVDGSGNPVARDSRVQRAVTERFQDQEFPGGLYNPVRQFFDAGTFGQHSLSLGQNAGRTNFFVTLSNQNTGGILLDAGGYTRNDVRLNLDHRVRDDLRLGVSTYYARSARQDLDDNLFFDLVNQAPDLDLGARDANGRFVFQPDAQSARPNPLYTTTTQDRRTKRSRFLGSVDMRYSPLEWLAFEGNASYDRAERRSDYFLDRDSRTLTQTFDRIGGLEKLTAGTGAMNATGAVNLLGRWRSLTGRGSARALMERENGDRFGYRGNDLLVPGVQNLNNVRSRLPVSADFLEGTPLVEIRTNSYVGTAGADWAGKYIVDGLVRRDGSSLFGPDNRWQTYYRASASWRMAEESWFPLKGLVTEFKPRFSRGTAGGRPSFADQFETYNINATGGLVKATLGNTALQPEIATETEIGLDLIVRNRYSLQVSRARTVTTDQLLLLPLPAPAGGFESQWQNAGTLTGNTLEATFEAQLVQRPNVGWTLGIVGDRTRNRITEFNRSCFITQTIIYRCAGVTLGTMYGGRRITSAAELLGVPEAQRAEFQVNDDGLLVWTGPGRDFRAGAWGQTATIGNRTYGYGLPITLRNADNTADSTLVIGDGNPTFRWGMSNNVRWRGLTVFALLDAQVGGNVYNRTKQRMYQYYRSADVDQAGKPQELKKPLAYYDALYGANNVNSWFVESGGYLKLREVSVRYALGGRLLAPLRTVGVRGASVSLIGRNLLQWSDYSGFDPEVGSINTRIDDFVYPRYRTVTGSVQVEF
jgi:TonB-linked SusC/RagA family outer membrane protein